MEIHDIAAQAGGGLAGLLGGTVGLFFWRKFKGRVVDAIVGAAFRKLISLSKGEGVADADLREFVAAVTLAFVHLAERKLPDSGLGAERLAWVEAMLLRVFPFLAHVPEADRRAFIEEAVKRMDDRLKEIEAAKPPSATP